MNRKSNPLRHWCIKTAKNILNEWRIIMEYLNLNNGTKIPAAGIGTFLMKPQEAQDAVTAALKNGYELVDTANAYMNEKAVGRGMKASGKAREDIYLSTKLWPSVYATADEAIDATLKRLDTDYIDLLFLHQPVGDYIGAYKAMERAVKAGKVKVV
jgi:diketogulonate reductase-like aldo/keto reductase